MERWRVPDPFILTDAIAVADLNTFAVRRALQPLEGGEITVREAAKQTAWNTKRKGHTRLPK